MDKIAAGVDVGGTNLRFGLFREAACLQESRQEVDLVQRCRAISDPGTVREFVLDLLVEGIMALRSEYPLLRRIGVAFPGFIDSGGMLLQSPNISGLAGFPLQEALSRKLGLEVVVENDANAAAYGEFWTLFQQRPALQNLLYLGLGTGVGGGWVHGGKVWRGEHGMAMEAGHIIVVPGGRHCGCGNRGCLEQYASAPGLAASYAGISGVAAQPGAIAAMARKGNPEALMAFRTVGETLGQALAHILKVADVTVVRIGGGLSSAWDCFSGVLGCRLDQDLIPSLRGKVDVQQGNSDDLAGMRGAALLALGLQTGSP